MTAANGALPRLAVTDRYVTGVSSGGYLATQLQVAWSTRFRGAAVFAAGPYLCALGNVVVALHACGDDALPTRMDSLYAWTELYARWGLIDPLSNLARSRTFLFHGTEDPTVAKSVTDNLSTFYEHYGVPLTYRSDVPAGHAWLSPLGPVPCSETEPPFINDCPGYDAQADLLQAMSGSAAAPNTGTPRGRLITFDQDRYAAPPSLGDGDIFRRGAAAIGMGSTGFLYLPDDCAHGAPCALVVALHGCRQTAEQVGDTFARLSGLNAYADTNRFVVLYPQARPDPTLGNPRGCWNWWGHLGPNDRYYATQRGKQMQTVMAMVAALGG